MPIEGQLHQVFHIFAYLKKRHNTDMVFDPSVPNFNAEKFQRQDWSQIVYVSTPPRIYHLTFPSVPMLIVTMLATLSQEDRKLVYLSTSTMPLFILYPRSKDILIHRQWK